MPNTAEIAQSNLVSQNIINAKEVKQPVEDFFQPKLSKKEELLKWIQQRKRVLTSDVIRWGSECGYYNRALRSAQELCSEGLIYRMRKDIQNIVFGQSKQEAWSVWKEDADWNIL